MYYGHYGTNVGALACGVVLQCQSKIEIYSNGLSVANDKWW